MRAESSLGVSLAKEDAAYGEIGEFSCPVFAKVGYLQ